MDARANKLQESPAEPLAVVGLERLGAALGVDRHTVAHNRIGALGKHAHDRNANISRAFDAFARILW